MRPFDATRLPTVVCGDKVTPSRIASQILLQGYLDAGCPEVDAPCEPLADSEDHGP
jgi:hypothetical protein